MSTLPIVIIFFVVVCLKCLFNHILSLTAYTIRENGILFSLLLFCSLWWVQIVGYVLVCRSCSFVCTLHHLVVIILQTYLKTLNLYNACQIHFVECVSKIKYIFSVIHYAIYGAVFFQFTHFPSANWDNIHFVLLSSSNRVRSRNNGMRCMSLYILVVTSFNVIFPRWCHDMQTHPASWPFVKEVQGPSVDFPH